MLTSRRTLQENPCMNCEYRDIHCHGSCNAYKKWRLKDQFVKHKIDKTRKDEREVSQISRKNRNFREI